MTRDEAKDYVKRQEPDFLPKAKKKVSGKNTYICPTCGKGSHGDGIARDKDNIHYKCFGTCGLYEDIIGLWKISQGITDDKEAFKTLYEHYNITIDETGKQPQSQERKKEEKREPGAPAPQIERKEGETMTDFNDFYLKASKNIEKTEYHRGLSLETLKKFYIGYVEEWKHPKAPNAPASPRLIIPVSKYSYIARDTRTELTEQQENYKKQKVKADGIETANWIFNREAIEKAQKPIIVVEGELDALSIIDVGGEAVGLGSIANIYQFTEYLKGHRPTQPLILSLDNDKDREDGKNPGQEAEKQLSISLKEMGIIFYRFNVAGEYKDANEHLINDRKAFKEAVEKAERIEETLYKNNSVSNHIQEFINGIGASIDTPCITTGFNNLDRVLDGGLYEGLYIVGAISSLGKTTLVLQIADQIAQAGHDVIIFSLEMARAELMSKSISRHTVMEAIENGIDLRNAKTARGITTGKRYRNYSDEERDLIKKAIEAYSSYSNNLYIQEGVGNIGAKEIKETVQQHIHFTGNKPVIIIDYLQIIAPHDVRASDKQNTDKVVLELKRISRDYKIPVIGISSFNRDNYASEVNMAAFKESGAIEYGSDVLIALQPQGMQPGTTATIQKENTETVKRCKQSEQREIEAVILKNRNGATGGKIAFDYYTLFNYFVEKTDNKTRNTSGYKRV